MPSNLVGDSQKSGVRCFAKSKKANSPRRSAQNGNHHHPKKWLAQFEAQLNPFSSDPEKRALKKQMNDMFRRHSPSDWANANGRATLDKLWGMVAAYDGHFVYSHEGLSTPWFFPLEKQSHFLGVQPSEFPVALHIKSLLQETPYPCAMEVIVTVRSQAEYLASLYAEHSHLRKNPSQFDFEERTRALLADPSTKGSGFLDYDALGSDAGLGDT